MDKKASISQAFVYIITAIVIIVTLMFGYQAVDWFIDKQGDVNIAEFKTSFGSDISGLMNEYGSLKKLQYDVPGSFSKICFIDYTQSNNPTTSGEPQYVIDTANQGDGPNIFLMKSDGPMSFNVDNIELKSGEKVECMNITSGSFRVIAESKGDKILLSKP